MAKAIESATTNKPEPISFQSIKAFCKNAFNEAVGQVTEAVKQQAHAVKRQIEKPLKKIRYDRFMTEARTKIDTELKERTLEFAVRDTPDYITEIIKALIESSKKEDRDLALKALGRGNVMLAFGKKGMINDVRALLKSINTEEQRKFFIQNPDAKEEFKYYFKRQKQNEGVSGSTNTPG